MPMSTDPRSFHEPHGYNRSGADRVDPEAEVLVSEEHHESHYNPDKHDEADKADEADEADQVVAEPFSASQSRRYWNTRHGEVADHRSGGSLAYDQATNTMLYDVRRARLIEALGADSDPQVPRRVLDAGCGKGYFSRSLVEYGHRVDGIDTSIEAIRECRRRATGSDTYAVSSLRSWRPPYLYDAVICVDVMFHLMDDDEWLSSLRNLAVLVRLGGRLVVADHDGEEDIVWGSYQKTRGPGMPQCWLSRGWRS